jgi:pyruvate formate lyase activating enzyme
MKGRINNIQKYSVNDGGGIRTVVFLQGCPLRCQWCSNPETQAVSNQLIYLKNKCVGCGRCVEACPEHIGCTEINSPRCRQHFKCTEACLTGALKAVYREYDVLELVRILERDAMFYRLSGGGVTISGGEPLVQWEFSAALLEELHEMCIDTALETCGHAPYDHLAAVADHCDRVLYDIKHMGGRQHQKHTGVSNETILGNLKRLAGTGKEIIIRVPLIHGVNDDAQNIAQTADLALENGIRELHLLPFHRLGEPKYEAIGQPVLMGDATVPEEHVKELKEMLENKGIFVCIGG